MERPICGLSNPPESLSCDCGHDFGGDNSAAFPGWGISLAWRQKVAAFWSISWPAWIGSTGLIILLTSPYPVDVLEENLSLIVLGGNVAFFAIQAVLTRRLVRKKYRSFRLHVVRDDGSEQRSLSMREAFSVWLWIFLPQLALLVIVSLIVWLWGVDLSHDTTRGLSSLSLWLRFLAIGPYGLGFALQRNYGTFRFEARGFRYV